MEESITHTITALLEGTRFPGKDVADNLDDFCEAYPYCQPAQMLRAKAHLVSGSEVQEKIMKFAMASAPDKPKFLHFMEQDILLVDDVSTDDMAAVPFGDEIPADDTTAVTDTGGVSTEGAVIPMVHEDMANGDAGGLSEGTLDQASKRDKQQQIIDRFLKDNPRISPLRESIPEPAVVKISLQEESYLVSETLAEVLLKQGKPDKACDIYEKLCLKYPEKSSYFAKKIEDIKNGPL